MCWTDGRNKERERAMESPTHTLNNMPLCCGCAWSNDSVHECVQKQCNELWNYNQTSTSSFVRWFRYLYTSGKRIKKKHIVLLVLVVGYVAVCYHHHHQQQQQQDKLEGQFGFLREQTTFTTKAHTTHTTHTHTPREQETQTPSSTKQITTNNLAFQRNSK